MCSFSVPRGADFIRSYVFPTGTDFSAYSAAFKVYASLGGSTLLTVTEAPTPNGSNVVFADSTVTVTITPEDIATFAVASDPTEPKLLQFDFFLTSGVDLVSKIHGGLFKVYPFGSSVSDGNEEITVSLDGDEVSVSVYAGPSFDITSVITPLGAAIVEAATGDQVLDLIDAAKVDFSNVGFVGAIPDGVTDNTALVLAAATAAAADGVALHLPAGTIVVGPVTFPAVKEVAGRGVDLTTIKLKRGTYSLGDPILHFTNSVYIHDLTIECDDNDFDGVYALVIEGVDRGVVKNVRVTGRFRNAILINGCDDMAIVDPVIESTNAASFRGIQVISARGTITGGNVSGSYANHLISVDSSNGVQVYGVDCNGANNGAFGVSFTQSVGCTLIGSYFKNTGYEAFQMTLCEDCVMTANYCTWETGYGADFGSSIDACERCVLDGNFYDNSYKAAAAIAGDAGISRACTVSNNYAHNCATRATAAAAGAPHTAAFLIYVGPNNCSDNEFLDNKIDTDSGKTVSYGYLENDPGAAGTISNTRAKHFTFLGSGTVTTRYSISASGSHLWMDEVLTWTPTISAASGTITASSVTGAEYQQNGRMVYFSVSVFITTNGTGSGSLKITLPVQAASSSTVYVVPGRENALGTGKMLQGVIDPTGVAIYTYDNLYPAADGAEILVSGWYKAA